MIPQAEAQAKIREWLPMGSTIYCIVRRVAASGMSRNIQLVYFDTEHDGDVNDRHPTRMAAWAMGKKVVEINGRDTIQVKGCGMDMCQHLVETLAAYVWTDDERAARKGGPIYKVRTL